MKAKDLIEILKQHPELPVMLQSERSIDYLAFGEIDCFDAEEGFVWVLVPEEEV